MRKARVCGINGILRFGTNAPSISREELLRTRDYMLARGPDGAGEWLAAGGEAALAHRRLAIIDLSTAGSQPMSGSDGRFWIVFNGEIYNYKELRAELSCHYIFRSKSDTEVILALFAREGVAGLRRLRGMFALAIWDDREKRLLLARDPNGIKPLYYSSDGRHLRFASQVKALVAGGAVTTRPDPAGLCGFLLWGAVPEPWTIYESVKAVPAGHLLWASADGVGEPEPLPASCEKGTVPPDILAAIEDSVTAHLVSDVPVAIYLSAGLDSGIVAALARRHVATPPITVTLRFREFADTPDDEGPLAAEVARALGTHHVERWVSRDEFLAGWPDALRAMDQPSIDGFNTYWVSKAAHEAGVKVALSGLGGDELLGGYPSFRQVPAWRRWVGLGRRMPGLTAAWPRVARWVEPTKPKLEGLMRYGGTLEGAYFLRRGLFLPDEISTILGNGLAAEGLAAADPVRAGRVALAASPSSDWHSVHALETSLYLRHQLLRDSDWASMAHSVELRVPFVDARLQHIAAETGFALSRRVAKRGVAERLAPELPPTLFRRRKTGFRIPVARWLGAGQPIGLSSDSRALALRTLEAFGLHG